MLTACTVEITDTNTLSLKEAPLTDGRTSGSATLHLNGDLFDITIEPKPIEDPRLKTIWGPQLTRILFKVKSLQEQGAYTLKIKR